MDVVRGEVEGELEWLLGEVGGVGLSDVELVALARGVGACVFTRYDDVVDGGVSVSPRVVLGFAEEVLWGLLG
ncbi:MAG: hypothetical protein GXO43_07710 [Crenarchaeota archaeon]|nr:hypothetical protein [Thermoproteota archaeon]